MAADQSASPAYLNIVRQSLAVFERIEESGENFDREEAFEIIDTLLNDLSIMSRDEAWTLAGDLSRSALTFEIDDDAEINRQRYASFVED